MLQGPLGFTLLHHAAALGFEEGVTWLLYVGDADVYFQTETTGETSLHRAASGGHVNVIKILLKFVNITKIQDGYGCLPIHNAAKFGREEAVDLLISANSTDVSIRENIGFTPLHWAAAGGHTAIVQKLLPMTDLSSVGVPTPDHLAMWGHNVEVLNQCYGLVIDTTVFTPERFYALVHGFKEPFETSLLAIEYLGWLCKCLGDRQIARDNLKAASAWFDLE